MVGTKTASLQEQQLLLLLSWPPGASAGALALVVLRSERGRLGVDRLRYAFLQY